MCCECYNLKLGRHEINPEFVWRSRLGQAIEQRMHELENDGLIGPLMLDPYPSCESCPLSKMIKFPFTGHLERDTQALDLVHTDVCGPINEMAHGGFHYFITYTNDHSRYGYMYL